MFCPNCGTKNSDTEQKCSQCGFSLLKPDVKAKFRGTMVMQGTTPARTEGGAAAGEAVGVAAAEARKSGAKPASPAPAAGGLKGTMIGVAPPDMQAALEAARAEALAKKAPAGPPVAVSPATMRGTPMERTPGAGSIQGGRASALKGTMIGVAPPEVGGLAAKSGPAAAGALPKLAPPNAPEAAALASGPGVGPKPAMPSQLKGTMIGVAPPEMQAAVAAAQAHSLGTPPTGRGTDAEALRKRDFDATWLGGTDPINEEAAPEEKSADLGASARVDAFQGTLLGQNAMTAPSPASPPAGAGPGSAPSTLGGVTVGIAGGAATALQTGAGPGGASTAFGQTVRSDTAGMASPPGVPVPAGPTPEAVFPGALTRERPTPAGSAAGNDPLARGGAGKHLPIEQEPKAASPFFLLLVAVVVVGVVLGAIMFFGGSKQEPPAGPDRPPGAAEPSGSAPSPTEGK